MNYQFKLGPEFTWALLMAISSYALQVLLSTDFVAVTEWKPVVIAIIVGLLRAVLGAILQLNKPEPQQPTPVVIIPPIPPVISAPPSPGTTETTTVTTISTPAEVVPPPSPIIRP